MAFIKRATIIGSFYTGNQIESLKHDWANFVRAGTLPYNNFEFEWDPENFVYYRARAITANVPNQNGDYFEDAELEKSYHTFIGKGVYYNHDSDSPDKAFGIILDATYHEFPDDKYVQVLAAIDKEDIEKKRPGLLNRIVSGQLRTTSMSVLVQECICSVCGNIAKSPEDLCNHMNPKSAGYVKGRTINGKKAYEINRGLTFIEDSIVDVPADPTAYIFQVFASYDVQNPKLAEHFKKYSMVKEAMLKSAEPDPQRPISLRELVDTVIENKIEQRVKRVVDEQVRKVIDPVLQKIDQQITPVVEPIVKEKVEEKSEKLPIVGEEPKKEPEKELTEEPEPKKEPEKSSKELEKTVPEFVGTEKKSTITDPGKASEFLLKSPEKIKLKEYPEEITIGPYAFRLKDGRYVVFTGDQEIGSIPVPKEFGILPRKSKEKFLLEKAQKLKPETTTSASLGGKKVMQGTYIRGKTFEDSYFVFSDANRSIKVRASDIIPKNIQKKILDGDETVAEPEDIIDQVVKMSQGSYDKLKGEVLPALAKRAYLENQKFTKKAEWSFNEEEIPSMKKPSPAEGPIASVSSEEVKESVEKPESGPSVKVKQYFGKLPGKGVGEPTQTINVQSSTSEDLVIKAKIDLLKKALEEEKEKREKAEKELTELKEKTEKKDKAVIIEELIDKVSGMTELEDAQKTKLAELLNKFAVPQLNILGQIIDILSAKPIEKATEGLAEKSLEKLPIGGTLPGLEEMPVKKKPEEPTKKEASIPQIFISNEDTDLDIIEIAQKSLER